MSETTPPSVWQVLGPVLAALAIIVAIILYLMQRRRERKELSYAIVSRNRLFSFRDEVKGKLQVLFELKPVDDPFLIVAKVAYRRPQADRVDHWSALTLWHAIGTVRRRVDRVGCIT